MNIGIYKTLTFGLILATISACSEGSDLGFLQADGASKAKRAPLTQASMMRGAVTLVPSSGYCIDPTTLKQFFALMARCDALGGKNGALDAPLGIMTVSLALAGATPIAMVDVLNAHADTKIIKQYNHEGIDMARLAGAPPAPDVSGRHWRAVSNINGVDLSVALFAPEGSRAFDPHGRRMIHAMLDASQSASVASAVAAKIQPKVPAQKKGLGAALAGLFD